MDTRRDFLKKAALLAGATSLANVIPLSIQKALAFNPPVGSTYLDAEHIVILMQENRSFDHCYGTLKGVRGFNDPRAIDLPDNNKVWLQTNSKGQTYAPFHLDINATKATWMSSLPHGWGSQSSARNYGLHDKWLDHKKPINPLYGHIPLTMGYHNRGDIPFYYALADAFTVCDQNFCSSLTGTNPNRLFFWTGTIRGSADENTKPCMVNDDMDYGSLNWATFPERVEKHGVSWKCYQNEVSIDTGLSSEEDAWLGNFKDNPLEFFEQYHIKLHHKHIDHLEGQIEKLADLIASLESDSISSYQDTVEPDAQKIQLDKWKTELAVLQKRKETYNIEAFEALSPFEKSLHRKAFDTNTADPDHRELQEITYNDEGRQHSMNVPKGDILHQFREDVTTGKLPVVSWLTAPESFSDHPGAPWFGAWYVSEVLDILTQQPEVWKKTIFILAYDENDGYFDHVPPFTPPHPHKEGTGKASEGINTCAEFVKHGANGDESPIGLGFRVPLVVVSPWSKGGWVNSQVFDHTSTLRFLEEFITKKTGKAITETNISPWRRTICGDLTSVFRPYYGDKIPVPSFPARSVFMEGIHKAKFKKMPDNYQLLNKFAIDEVNKDSLKSAYVPDQEQGVRPSCPLPYQLYVDGRVTADNQFEIVFNNRDELFGDKTAGAPFNVYAPGHHTAMRNYAVKAGGVLKDEWLIDEFENGKYHLKVYGPNGFYREFAGDKTDKPIEVVLDYEKDNYTAQFTGNVVLHFLNKNETPCMVSVTDNAYQTNYHQLTLPPMQTTSLVLNLKSSFNWYDVSINIGSNSTTTRYAGRVETGRDSFSDPYMGKAIIPTVNPGIVLAKSG